tara:strand:+ start:196 stop:459 length:264 start_codon:yes stop_codon:yes gene_type:complete
MAHPLYVVEVVTTTKEINYHKIAAKSASEARRLIHLEVRGEGRKDILGLQENTSMMIFPDVMSEKKNLRKTHLWSEMKDKKREFARE